MLICSTTGSTKAVFVRDVVELDSEVYPEEYQGTYQSVKERFKRNRESYVLALDGDTLAGYVCYFPISDDLYYEMMFSDERFDDNIKPEDVVSYSEGVNVLIISVVVKASYRDTGVIQSIITEFRYSLSEKAKECSGINSVLAEVISEDGLKLMTRLGFKNTGDSNEDSRLMVCDGDNLKKLLNWTEDL